MKFTKKKNEERIVIDVIDKTGNSDIFNWTSIERSAGDFV